MPVGYTESGEPIYAEWTTEMKNALYANFKFLDADGKGLDRSKLRAFYPILGWNDVQKGLDALIADGRLESRLVTVGGRSVETFFWKGA